MLGRKTLEILFAVLKVGIDVNRCNVNLENTQFVDQKAVLMTKFPKVFLGPGETERHRGRPHF